MRSTVIETLLQIGELTSEQAITLSSDPSADFALSRVNFDSLVVLDFCLKIETKSGVIIEPEEIAQLQTMNELASLLAGRAS